MSGGSCWQGVQCLRDVIFSDRSTKLDAKNKHSLAREESKREIDIGLTDPIQSNKHYK